MVRLLNFFILSLLSVVYAKTCPEGGASSGVYGPGINSRVECIGLCVSKGYISPQIGASMKETLIKSAAATIIGPDLCDWEEYNTFCLCNSN